MEKYGQYRDKGSGIAPFFPIPPPPTNLLLLPFRLVLVPVRIGLLILAWLVWLAFIQWLPAGSILRKANQWCLLGIPGVWWIDLQVDGVRRGSLSQTPRGKLPYPGTIIASSFTSPLDVLYLAAIFDPIFTQSSPTSTLLRPISQESALANCFNITNPFAILSPDPAAPVTLASLVEKNPGRIIVVFPEATTSNGRAILRLSPSLLSAGPKTKIFPVSLRYTPADIVTPVPGWWEAIRFIARLNSGWSHCIRVRIGGPTSMTPAPALSSTPRTAVTDRANGARNGGYEANFFDTLQTSPAQKVVGDADLSDATSTTMEDDELMTPEQRRALDAVADALARLGRVKRVDLGVQEKERFVEAWRGRGKGMRTLKAKKAM